MTTRNTHITINELLDNFVRQHSAKNNELPDVGGHLPDDTLSGAARTDTPMAKRINKSPDYNKLAEQILSDWTSDECPFCHKPGMTYGNFDVAEDRLYQRVSCPHCQKSWHVGYTGDSVGFDAEDADQDFYYPWGPGQCERDKPAPEGRHLVVTLTDGVDADQLTQLIGLLKGVKGVRQG